MPQLPPDLKRYRSGAPLILALNGPWSRLSKRWPFAAEVLILCARADIVDRAAALALFCLFAAVPSLFVGLSFVGFVLGEVDKASGASGLDIAVSGGAMHRLTSWLAEALPGVTWNPAEFAAALVHDRRTNGIVGTFAAISLGLTVFARIDAAVRAVFGQRKRSALRAAGYLSLLVLFGALAAMLLTVFAPLSEWGLHVASRGVSTLSFGQIHLIGLLFTAGQVLPVATGFFLQVRWSVGHVDLRRLLAASLAFGAIWFGGQRLFSVYVHQIIRMDAVYGALTGIVALLMWLFYANIAFLTTVAALAAWEQRARDRTVQAHGDA